METSFLFKGIIIGFVIAAPVGPIGVLCFRRTMSEGIAFGFVSGLGAASADAVYGSIAGFGLAFISTFLIDQQLWLRLAGGAFLCYLGIKTFLTKPAEKVIQATESSLVGAYVSTFFLTLMNPLTILVFSTIFAALGINAIGNNVSAGFLVLGIFIGSTSWWLFLSGFAALFRDKVNHHGLRWLNRISGSILTGSGLYSLGCCI